MCRIIVKFENISIIVMFFEETVVLAFLNDLQKLQNRAACYLEACPGLCFAMVIGTSTFRFWKTLTFKKEAKCDIFLLQ